MEKKYKYTKTTVSSVKYHFVFCPRYRRKIFNIPGFKERFKELVSEACEEHGIEIINLSCGDDYVYIYVSVFPSMSTRDIMNCIKSCTTVTLRKEFEQLKAMPNLWTRNYFVTTESGVDQETIQWYVNSQKKRP